jgi:hypothetical protein
MNCPQCQTANAPGAAFCGNCGAGLSVAEPANAPATGYGPQGTGTPLGYGATSGPASYDAPTGYNAPTGYDAPTGYNAPGGYNAAGGYNNPGTQQQPGGYPQGQYQPPMQGGGYTPGSRGGASVPPVSFDLNRLTTVDKVVAVSSLIALISIWLPWFTASATYLGQTDSGSASATTAHGAWMYLEFIVALVLIVYLVARAAWDRLPFSLPVAHAPLLIVGTGLQLLFMLIAFFDIPSVPGGDLGSGVHVSVSWSWGAFIGLLAALAAAGPVIVPAVRSYLDSRNAR